MFAKTGGIADTPQLPVVCRHGRQQKLENPPVWLYSPRQKDLYRYQLLTIRPIHGIKYLLTNHLYDTPQTLAECFLNIEDYTPTTD